MSSVFVSMLDFRVLVLPEDFEGCMNEAKKELVAQVNATSRRAFVNPQFVTTESFLDDDENFVCVLSCQEFSFSVVTPCESFRRRFFQNLEPETKRDIVRKVLAVAEHHRSEEVLGDFCGVVPFRAVLRSDKNRLLFWFDTTDPRTTEFLDISLPYNQAN